MKRALALALVLLSGCYKTHFVTAAQPFTPPPPLIWHHDLIYGLIELTPTDLDKVCPGGVAKVDYQQTFLDGLLRSCIGGSLWQPSTIQVWCAAGGSVPSAPPGAPTAPPPPAVPPALSTPPVIH